MRFEKALEQLRAGKCICRAKSVDRSNGVFYMIDGGQIQSRTIETGYITSNHRANSMSLYSVMADDWVVYEGEMSMVIYTLAWLKRRIQLGTKLLKTAGCKGKGVGEVREVDRLQKNAFSIGGSWLYWGRATDYDINEKGFSVYFTGKPHTKQFLVGSYEFVDDNKEG